MAISENFSAPASPGTALVTYRVSRHTIGLLLPSPGSATFHLTFFVSLHSSGGLAAGASPVPSGPRHVGHACPAAAAVRDACASTEAVASASNHPATTTPATTTPTLRPCAKRI